MKISRQQLKQIVREEIEKAMAEEVQNGSYDEEKARAGCKAKTPPQAWDPRQGCIPLEASKPKKPKKKSASPPNPGSRVPKP